MARSLEGKTFFVNYNNGVTAITPEWVVRNLELVCDIKSKISSGFTSMRGADLIDAYNDALKAGLAHIVTVPVFTFVDAERMSGSPWFTGATPLEIATISWIEKNGGKIEGGAGYVPFSNGVELGVHGPDAMASELRYVATGEQFREIFGIGIRELETWYANERADRNNDAFVV